MSTGYKSNINNLIKQSTAIKFCFKAGLSAKNAFEMFQKTKEKNQKTKKSC